MPIFFQNSINGSFEWLDVPSFLLNYGPSWADNILCPSPRWGVGITYDIWDLESQPGGYYGGVEDSWHGAVPACPDYLPRSPENARVTVRRVCDDLLQEHCLACAQSLSYFWNVLREHLVNRTDCALDDLWDEPVLQ